MAKKRASDFTLLLSTILLVFIGIIMVFSSSWPDAIYKMKDGYYFLRKQIIASVLGLFILFFFMNFNYKKLEKIATPIFILSLLSGLLVFTPLGREFNGARRWVYIGFTTFMPSDLIKIGSIIYMSYFLSKDRNKIKDFKKGVLPSLIIIGISCGLIIAQKDLSTSVTLGLTLISMVFVAGIQVVYLVVLGAMGGFGIYKAIMAEEFRKMRMLAFRDPFLYKNDYGWQAVQSLYALGSGGLFGLGLGKSRQKFFYIPEPYNDFIFSIIGEELGFLGCLTVILLFLLLIWRGIKIALNVDDLFGCFLATGITALITIQTLIHIAVVTSSVPTTGIPLPLISAGGTSLILYMGSIGILLNISRHTQLDRS